ncbi:hypothetical protein CAOG_06977 [Capsaspora owczarzaki ATCC 30864]|uniref:Uncharacterized protein n=1 Tax=Capsaspora owczarzaki (strain ATCC 30864) TaxID=595528 RepID=A0A0D2WW76_CAPO3|nr:hypothetical protein CAOG_06977 [Capsaspora owczarzaki ATCC 30864]KJE96698.1 hypothetical protein CAOG_006977 [Capsaspora owczarzaki ATCC 30864]|eukprot:XP_004343701.1 hypothetical protein CAOG_06977 [Capsaspora owczarzaki ATCC 30864]
MADVAVAMMDDGLHGAPKTAPRTAPETAPMALLVCGLAFVFAIYVVYCMRYVPSTMDALFIIAQPLSFLLVDATWNWTYGKPRQVSCAALSAAGLAYLAITYLSAPSEPWIWCVLVASQIWYRSVQLLHSCARRARRSIPS